MRKILALTLAVLMMFACATAAMAEPFYLETAGVTIEVPEGMTTEDISDETSYALKMTVNGRNDLVYTYQLTYIEEYKGLWIEDLSEEQGTALIETFTKDMKAPVIDTVVAENEGDISYLLVGEEDNTQLHCISILNGWMCCMSAVAAQALTEEEVELNILLLGSITFDE